jgi:O-antigen/teichoic acid export membrane protein
MDEKPQNPQLMGSAIPRTWRRRFSINVVLSLGTRMLMLASSLATSVIIARWLGAQGVGSLAVINISIALGIQLGCAGLPSTNVYLIAQDRSRLGSVWSNALLFGVLAGSAIALLMIAIEKFHPSLFGEVPASLVGIGALSIPFQLVTLLGANVFLGLGRVDRFVLTDAVSQLLLLVNALVALILLGSGLHTLVSFNTAAAALVSVIVIFTIWHALRTNNESPLKLDAQVFRRMLRSGIKFHVPAVAGIIIFRADLLLVNHFRGATEAGVYAVASQMGNLLMLLPAIIGTLLFPRVASQPDLTGGLTMRATRHTAFVMLVLCLAAIPLSFALPIVYGSAFKESSLLLLILLPGVYLIGIESVMVQHFNGLGLPAAIPVFWLITVFVNVTLNLILIPSLGAIGAAIVSTLTYSLIFVLVTAYFRHKTGNSLSKVLLLRGDEFRDLISANRLGS